MQVLEGVRTTDDLGNDTLSTATVRHLIIYIGTHLEETGTSNLGCVGSEDVRTPEKGVHLVAAVDATLYLPTTFHHEETTAAALSRLLLQRQQTLHLGVLGTRYQFHDYKSSHSFNHNVLLASLGMRQSPRGESDTLPTLGPSGRQERLNCCEKKRRQNVVSHFLMVSLL